MEEEIKKIKAEAIALILKRKGVNKEWKVDCIKDITEICDNSLRLLKSK